MRARKIGPAGRHSTNSNLEFGRCDFDHRRPDTGRAPGIEWNSVFGARLINSNRIDACALTMERGRVFQGKFYRPVQTSAASLIDHERIKKMTVALHDKFGNIDLTLIDEEAVASLTEEQQRVLAILIDATHAREAADLRKIAAEQRVRAAMTAETKTFEAHIAANPAPTRIETMKAAQAAYRRATAQEVSQ
jgi:hypothetical protein